MDLHEMKIMRDTVKSRLEKAEANAARHRERLDAINKEIRDYIAEQKALVAELEGGV